MIGLIWNESNYLSAENLRIYFLFPYFIPTFAPNSQILI